MAITKDLIIGDVLDKYPETAELFLQMGMHHQRMAQPVFLGIEQRLMPGAEALLIHLNPGIRLHHRSAQESIHINQFIAPPQGAQGAFPFQFHRIPYRDGINMIQQSKRHSPS